MARGLRDSLMGDSQQIGLSYLGLGGPGVLDVGGGKKLVHFFDLELDRVVRDDVSFFIVRLANLPPR